MGQDFRVVWVSQQGATVEQGDRRASLTWAELEGDGCPREIRDAAVARLAEVIRWPSTYTAAMSGRYGDAPEAYVEPDSDGWISIIRPSLSSSATERVERHRTLEDARAHVEGQCDVDSWVPYRAPAHVAARLLPLDAAAQA